MNSFTLKSINYKTASNMINDYHYSHRTPQVIFSFGLYEDDRLVGCVTYGRPATPQVAKSVYPLDTKIVYELNRLVILTDTNNAASFTIGNSLKLLDNGLIIVSYADKAYGHVGYVYQATNFYYAGEVKAHDSEYILNGYKYHPRVLSHMGINNPTQWSKDTGAVKLPIKSKYRYIFITGNKNTKNNIMNNIQWKLSKEYPKGDTTRHETVIENAQITLL